MQKIVIASDSFKGSLTSAQVAQAASEAVRDVYPDCVVVSLCIGDGGEGTAEALASVLDAEAHEASVHDPLGRKLKAVFHTFRSDSQLTAIIESASASGLSLLSPDEYNPLAATTYGTGELINAALEHGCRRFMIGLGGSATNEGGTGMLEALGFRFSDADGNLIKGLCGGKLNRIACIDSSAAHPALSESEFIAACDVDTPFCGPEGASAVFAPQKGADAEAVEILEDGMQSFNRVIANRLRTDLSLIPGAGAAGGLGGALRAFLGARLVKGIDVVLDAMDFDAEIMDADLIITGEGRIDSQTSKGKVVSGVAGRAARQDIPVLAIAGIVDLPESEWESAGLAAVCPIAPRPQTAEALKESMKPENAYEAVRRTVGAVLQRLPRP